MNAFDLSREAIRKFKKKLNQPLSHRPLKKTHRHTSLTDNEQKSILDYNDVNPFHPPKRIKINLNLKCHQKTIANVLKRKGIRSFNPHNH